jgi:two-component system, chemotaxis family, chemotaxis protein CheY
VTAHPSMPILVVEDSQTTVRILHTLLSRLGFKDVDDAPDGSSALVKLSEKKYDLVIADWNMEPMNGFELLRQVRSERRLFGMRFILMTAAPNTENIIAAKKAGVSNYLIKPFTADALKAKIDTAFIEGSC